MRMPPKLANGHVWFVKSPRCVVMLTPLCSGGILLRTEPSRSIAWMVLPGESRSASARVNVPVPQPRSAHFVGPTASTPLSASISIASRRRTVGSYCTPRSRISVPPSDAVVNDGRYSERRAGGIVFGRNNRAWDPTNYDGSGGMYARTSGRSSMVHG